LGLTVTLVEALGHEQLIHGTVGEGVPVVVRVPATGGGQALSAPVIGSRLIVAFAPADIHLFDAVTMERIDA
jgi:hypothetical protein